MELYHGSDVIVEKPILLPHQRMLDFWRRLLYQFKGYIEYVTEGMKNG
jgi:hypothetical protein